MSHAEFVEWQEYARLEPFGEHYADLRAGSIAAAVYNINRDTKKAPEPYQPLDMCPWNSASKHAIAEREAAEPVLLEDPKAQADLIRAAIFGIDV